MGEQGETRWAAVGETGSQGLGMLGRRILLRWDGRAMAGCWAGEQHDKGMWKEESGPGG